jgi:hypothetical protein
MIKIAVYPKFITLLSALLVSTLLVACGGGQDPILGGDIARIAPTVTAVAPVNKAIGVAININVVTAEFSEPVGPLTGTASFDLTCSAPCVNPNGTVTLDSTHRIATFTLPAATNLAKNTVYTGTVTGAVGLNSGLAMVDPFVWKFTTGLVADLTRPTVTLTVPATTTPGPTTGTPSNTAITAAFSEDMAPLTIDAASFKVTCSAPCVSPAGTVSYVVGSKTAVFTPSAVLVVGKTYTATITTAVTDLAGNTLAGNQAPLPAASDYVWTFTTTAAVQGKPVSVFSTNPSDTEIAVCPDSTINATFSVPSGLKMNPLSLTTTTFSVTGPGPGFSPVLGTVSLDSAGTGKLATFTPNNPLTNGVTYFVTILSGNNGVKDLAVPANTMLNDKAWSFTAGPSTGACTAQIAMGLATPFADAATHGVTNTITAPITTINGNVVLDPNFTCNAVSVPNNGTFGLCGGAPPVLNGQVITNTFPNTTDSAAIEADLNQAFLSTCFPGRPAAACSLNTGTTLANLSLGALTGSARVLGQNYFTPGVYTSASTIDIANDITLDAQGDSNAVFIFQAGSALTIADGSIATHARVLLINGAKASNVWWSVGSSATIGVQAEFRGNVLSAFDITMKTGASSCGRMMAGAWTGSISISGALIFDSNLVSIPGNGCPP